PKILPCQIPYHFCFKAWEAWPGAGGLRASRVGAGNGEASARLSEPGLMDGRGPSIRASSAHAPTPVTARVVTAQPGPCSSSQHPAKPPEPFNKKTNIAAIEKRHKATKSKQRKS